MHITIPELPNLLRTKTNIIPANIFEIGASNGADAWHLQQSFGVPPEHVYCFEANPNNYQTLCNNFPTFNNFHVAVSDFTGKQIFQLHGPAADISSFKKRISHYVYQGHYLDNYDEIEIDTYRMDDFINRKTSTDLPDCSYIPGVGAYNLHEVLPRFIGNSTGRWLGTIWPKNERLQKQ